jgi:hypothetical protein
LVLDSSLGTGKKGSLRKAVAHLGWYRSLGSGIVYWEGIGHTQVTELPPGALIAHLGRESTGVEGYRSLVTRIAH